MQILGSAYASHSCSPHTSGRSLRSFAKLIPSGSSPLRILSTISGASEVSLKNRPTYVRSTLLAAARFFKAGAFARFELPLPAVRFGQGGNERPI